MIQIDWVFVVVGVSYEIFEDLGLFIAVLPEPYRIATGN